MVLLRVEYEAAVRFPLQLLEDVGLSHLDQCAPMRLAYENLLVKCDRAAAHLLDDDAAAARAFALRRRTAPIRFRIALAERRARQRLASEGVIRMELWRQQRDMRASVPPSSEPVARSPWRTGPGPAR